MLGCVGMVLGNVSIVIDVYVIVYCFDLKNSDVVLGYVEVLICLFDFNDNCFGGELLCQLVRMDYSNICVLSMYVFNVFEQQ